MARRSQIRASASAGGWRGRDGGWNRYVAWRGRHRPFAEVFAFVVCEGPVVNAMTRTSRGAIAPVIVTGRNVIAIAQVAERRDRFTAALLGDHQNLPDTEPAGVGNSFRRAGIASRKSDSQPRDKRDKNYCAGGNPRSARNQISLAWQSVQAPPPRLNNSRPNPSDLQASIGLPARQEM